VHETEQFGVERGMTARRLLLYSFCPLLLLAPLVVAPEPATMDTPGVALVNRALATELRSAQDTQHPMRYRLRKSSPRLASTKEIFETKDGAVARLVSINDRPLSTTDEEKEQVRLNSLLSNPSRQRHRKQAEDEDTARVMKVLRVLPNAFTYRYAGAGVGPTGKVEKFTFHPNRGFDPPDLETQVLTAMAGEIWIDAAQERVARLEGHLQDDVDFGWGILGRLNKGGWIEIEQDDVGNHQWRVVRFQMVMNGRILLKTKAFDTVEEESKFAPVPVGLSYEQAIQMLRSDPGKAEHGARDRATESVDAGKPRHAGRAYLWWQIRPYLTLAKTMTRVNKVNDSISASPRTRNVKIPARAPGLRARASTADPTALPCPSPHRPAAIPIPIPAPIGTRLTTPAPPSATAGMAKQSAASAMNMY
jgi:hypothetical protein